MRCELFAKSSLLQCQKLNSEEQGTEAHHSKTKRQEKIAHFGINLMRSQSSSFMVVHLPGSFSQAASN